MTGDGLALRAAGIDRADRQPHRARAGGVGSTAYINLEREQDFGAIAPVAAFERRSHEMLDAAYAAGIRYVDAARSYGMAEAFLGSWLTTRGLSGDAITIGSKWGYTYVGAWRIDAPAQEVKDLSVDTLRRQLGESRALLGERPRLYQIHSATLREQHPRRPRTALRDELGRPRARGLAIGLTAQRSATGGRDPRKRLP